MQSWLNASLVSILWVFCVIIFSDLHHILLNCHHFSILIIYHFYPFSALLHTITFIYFYAFLSQCTTCWLFAHIFSSFCLFSQSVFVHVWQFQLICPHFKTFHKSFAMIFCQSFLICITFAFITFQSVLGTSHYFSPVIFANLRHFSPLWAILTTVYNFVTIFSTFDPYLPAFL